MLPLSSMEQMFSKIQLDKLSDILISIGQVVFASIAVPSFFGLDTIEPDIVPSGLGLMLGSWVLSIFVVKGGEERK